MSLTIDNVGGVTVSPERNGYMSVTLDGVSATDALPKVDIKAIIAYYGSADLLDEIGRDTAIDHFQIEEAE